MNNLEQYFDKFRKQIIGNDAEFETPYGIKKMVYADWIASGRLYRPIEDKMTNLFGPLVGNTHSEASETGVTMTNLYHAAHSIIKKHVNAGDGDVIISRGAGMTGVVGKLQRILGLKIPEQSLNYCKCKIEDNDRPVVFITHLEHHSNHTSWLETIAEVIVLEPTDDMKVDPECLRKYLEKYKSRKLKIGSFSAGSNVTGVVTPYYKLAEIMHEYGGYAFIDYAASAPYVKIDMHPSNPKQCLDAIFFSPHKALGGPGSSGVVIFNKKLYKNKIPDIPGGGTVKWTNRWNEYAYIQDIEAREDGGTPAFLQTMRVALSLKLKEEMGYKNIMKREQELIEIAFEEFDKISGLHLLADNIRERIGVFSFYIEKIHHNLIVRILNDRFGIQVRGGCSCAGTYGHFLLNVTLNESHRITQQIDGGDLTDKPGWVRLSIHPTMTNRELYFILDAIKQITENISEWQADYYFDKEKGEFFHNEIPRKKPEDYFGWFDLNQ
ncbi:MAG: aminotransferase class V-fold PLP-dependent enzyme [bacterium]|nr:aminotransferase class V-fold PLP-dependent enzyme [bacterium]